MKRKKIVLLVCAMMLISALLAGCAAGQADHKEKETSSRETTAALQESGGQAEDIAMSLEIRVGDESFTAVLEDNDSVKALVGRLPMTMEMEEMNGNEKFCYLQEALPAAAENIGQIRSGDLMLFGDDCLVLFYEDFHTSYNYTRLGHIKDVSGLKAALGSGDVTVSINGKA